MATDKTMTAQDLMDKITAVAPVIIPSKSDTPSGTDGAEVDDSIGNRA